MTSLFLPTLDVQIPLEWNVDVGFRFLDKPSTEMNPFIITAL